MAVANVPTGAITKPETTTPARWNPFVDFDLMERRLDDLFGRNFGAFPWPRFLPAPHLTTAPNVDIYEKANLYELFAAVPGYAATDVTVEATPDSISICGKLGPLHTEEAAARRQEKVTEAHEFDVYYTLPVEIDPNNIKAELKDGVLHVTLLKTKAARAATVKVEVTPG